LRGVRAHRADRGAALSPPGLRVLLIGGSSHAGKSSLARRIAERLGGETISTDSLARHPGRPWRRPPHEVPLHVVEHYRDLSPEALLASVLAHYRAMWPLAEDVIRARLQAAAVPLVLEGSALWPPLAAALPWPGVRALWLTADPALFRGRIEAESGYAAASPSARALIEAFIARTLLYDQAMRAELARLGLRGLEVGAADDLERLADVGLQRAVALGVTRSAPADPAPGSRPRRA